MKVVLIIFAVQYTIYFTFESIIFQSYHNMCLKVKITEKRKIRKSQASKYQLSRGFFYYSEGGGSTFVSPCFFKPLQHNRTVANQFSVCTSRK